MTSFDRGGSGDSVELIDEKVVKTCSIDRVEFLQSQYNFLKNIPKNISDYFPKVYSELTSDDKYSYSMEYINGIDMVDFIIQNTVEESWNIINEAIDCIESSFHLENDDAIDTSASKRLIKEILFPAISFSLLDDKDKVYLKILCDELFRDETVVDILSHVGSGECFGDFTISNMIVCDNRPVLIDPSQNNIFWRNIEFEISKLYQSLEYYYELVQLGIDNDNNKFKYDQLKINLDNKVKIKFNQRSINQIELLKLHLLIRRLKYEKNKKIADNLTEKIYALIDKLMLKYTGSGLQ